MDKITFSQYIQQSKQQLITAIDSVPVVEKQYQVYKYCSLVVEDDDGELQTIGLKPNHKLSIKWRYDDPTNPTVDDIAVLCHEKVDEDDKYGTIWKPTKLAKWLMRHTK